MPEQQKPNNHLFHFRQFSLSHHRSGMKVGTDAVLLSTWVNLTSIKKALDVGTGSGIIALMLAARGIERVDAVEIDPPSAHEADENFKSSPFKTRLTLYHEDFVKFYTKHQNLSYDLIISNPPFFINDMRPSNPQRKKARHTDSLSYDRLIEGAFRLLDKNGIFSVVLPYNESRVFMEKAANQGFYLKRKLLIFPKPCKEPNRINLELVTSPTKTSTTEKFIIRNENGSFSEQYKNLLSPYYLNIKG
jgi:tRNA1Val (adenine37-N6)-methyltransferase